MLPRWCLLGACLQAHGRPTGGGGALSGAALAHLMHNLPAASAAQGSRMGWLAVSLGFGLSFGVTIFMLGEAAGWVCGWVGVVQRCDLKRSCMGWLGAPLMGPTSDLLCWVGDPISLSSAVNALEMAGPGECLWGIGLLPWQSAEAQPLPARARPPQATSPRTSTPPPASRCG